MPVLETEFSSCQKVSVIFIHYFVEKTESSERYPTHHLPHGKEKCVQEIKSLGEIFFYPQKNPAPLAPKDARGAGGVVIARPPFTSLNNSPVVTSNDEV